MTRKNQLPEVTPKGHQTIRERLFRPQKVDNYDAEMDQIFFSGNDQSGNALVRDTVVTIYPSGR